MSQFGYTHGKAASGRTRTRWGDYISNPWSHGASRTIRGCWKQWGISNHPRAAAPAILPEGKASVNMEW